MSVLDEECELKPTSLRQIMTIHTMIPTMIHSDDDNGYDDECLGCWVLEEDSA